MNIAITVHVDILMQPAFSWRFVLQRATVPILSGYKPVNTSYKR